MAASIDETTLAFGKPIFLTTLDGQLFEAGDAKLFVRRGGEQIARLTFRIDRAGYQRVLDRSLFNLLPLVRGHAELPLEGDAIEITAHLRGELLADLYATELDEESIASAFVERDRGGLLGAMASTESWLADSIVAKVDLPADLQGLGELASGYQTAWGRDALEAETAAPELRDVIAGFFEEQGWDTEAIGDSLLCTTVDGERGAWRFLVRVDDDQGLCTLSSVHPVEVPDGRRIEIAAILAGRNRELDVAAYDIDLTDGEVRLRSTLFAGASPALFSQVALANIRDFDDQFDDLAQLFGAGN